MIDIFNLIELNMKQHAHREFFDNLLYLDTMFG